MVSAYADRKMLKVAVPRTFLQRLGQRRPLPSNETKSIVFRRYEAFDLAQAPLSEGVAPTATTPSRSDVTATVLQWGAYLRYSDIHKATVDNPALNEYLKRQGEQAARTVEANIRDEVAAGTSVFYGNNEASRSALTTTTHAVSRALLDKVVRYLDGNDAGKFTEKINATTKISTSPIRESYYALTHPDVTFTLRRLEGWRETVEYASVDGAMEGEIGSINGIRFLESTLAKKFVGGGGAAVGDVRATGGVADVYTILVFAMDAFGVVPLANMSLESIMHPIGSAGASIPLNQWGTIGWKYTGTQTILNDNFQTRVEITARNNAPV